MHMHLLNSAKMFQCTHFADSLMAKNEKYNTLISFIQKINKLKNGKLLFFSTFEKI